MLSANSLLANAWVGHTPLLQPNSPQWQKALSLLGTAETSRFIGFKNPRRAAQFLTARALLRQLLSQNLNVAVSGFSFSANAGIAIEAFSTDPSIAAPFISVSHSDEFAACAISAHAAIGFDIEQHRARRNYLEVSAWAYLANEHAWLIEKSESMQKSAFYELWTGKEALYKLESVLGLEPQWRFKDFSSGSEMQMPAPAQCWHFKQLAIDTYASLVSSSNIVDVNWQYLQNLDVLD